MDQLYSGHGIRFHYPGNWELSEEPGEQDRDVTITVAGPETSFWMLTLLAGRPDAKRVLREALETFRGEYGDLDEYPAEATICETACEACDLHFLQYDLVNSAYLRVFPAGSRTAFLLYQGNDRELETTRPILEAITESLVWEQTPSFFH